MDKYKCQINKYRSYVNFMLSEQQWSGLTKKEIDEWLSNFDDLNTEEKVLIYKLLTSIIYYSENDIIDVLEESVNNNLFYDILLEKQKESDFCMSRKALSNILNEEMRKSCFIPLLDRKAPGESANYIIRLLDQQQIISSYQSVFLDNVVEKLEELKFSHLIIIDDCLGSGNQLRKFWNKTANVDCNGKSIKLVDYCKKNCIDMTYLVLFGYDRSIEAVKKEISELRICCVRTLNDRHRVFDENTYIWENQEELKRAYSILDELTKQFSFQLYGYSQLDFLFIMHKTIPNWSLPILWKETYNWKPLLRRKNSDV